MIPDLPPPEWVRAVCERLGYTAAQPLTPGQINTLVACKRSGRKSHESHTDKHLCGCGKAGTHQVGNGLWECEECTAIRLSVDHGVR